MTLSLTVFNDWGTGYCARGDVTNTGAAPVRWQVSSAVQGRIYTSWNAVITVSGNTLSAIGVGWNNTLAAGGKTQFGFCANR